MTSKAFETGTYMVPPPSPQEMSIGDKTSRNRRRTVYHAVAGEISTAGFIPKHPVISSGRDTASSSANSLPPEVVLYQSLKAPMRYAEFDVYFANEKRSVTDLPGSDLLKSLHCYASEFYSHSIVNAGADDWKSLEETALLAFGILLEEMTLETLGKTGDLVFTEGEEVDKKSVVLDKKPNSKQRPFKRRRLNLREQTNSFP